MFMLFPQHIPQLVETETVEFFGGRIRRGVVGGGVGFGCGGEVYTPKREGEFCSCWEVVAGGEGEWFFGDACVANFLALALFVL